MQRQCDIAQIINENQGFEKTLNLKDKLVKSEPDKKQKKRFFEVYHKKEIIYINKDKNPNNNADKKSIIHFKCIYCGSEYNNINRFEAHMRIHVS